MKKNLLSNLLLIGVLIFGFVAVGSALAVEHKIKFEWHYPADQNSIINGFRIYNATNPEKPYVLATIKQGSARTVELVVDLQDGKNLFFSAPYIGNREGLPSEVSEILISPMYKIDMFRTVCETCK